jgi:cell division protein FtsI/penicillin-binding protein 2/cell division protein FtsW (lipid II flippase)
MSAVLEARGRTTRSSAAERRRWRSWRSAFERDQLIPIGLALSVAVFAWLLVYPAKSAGFAETGRALQRGEILNLNALRSADQLDPILRGIMPDAPERAFVADEVFRHLPAGGAERPLENVGALAAIRVRADAVSGRPDLPTLGARAALGVAPASSPAGDKSKVAIGLFTTEQFQVLKPLFVVRESGRFRGAFLLHVLIILVSFAFMHVGLHATGKTGDRWLLPIALALTGIGFAMLVSLRDPLRDQMLFTRFADGTLFGGIALVLCAIPSYERGVLRRLAFVPLIGALAFSLALVILGRGPTGSDARVNLFGTQPMELIRVLLVLFLAGYFSSRWALLRELDERPLGEAWYLRILKLPRLHHVLPVAIGVAASLLLFFVQRDLGPALLLIALFLSLYAVTRREVGLLLAGLAAVLSAFAISYLIGFPHTVSLRTAMWLDPWGNGQSHGDQIAHGLWAFASGGLSGTGLGLGAPAVVPAAHTDMILAAVGEELGFLGLAACMTLLALLVVRGFRIARRAPEAYTMFLALGLTLGIALQVLLIAGGVAGLTPLSGVVTPFLSFGRSAQVVHFATLGILWSLAASGATVLGEKKPAPRLALAGLRSGVAPAAKPVTALGLAFDRPRGILLAVIGAMGAAVLLKLAWVQVVRADSTFARGSLALQADGEYRYQYNPRLRLVAQSIPRGNIFDRNGVLLATSRWKDLTDRRAALARLGVDIDRACLATDERHYPFGGVTFHVLGDLVSRANWGATNTAYVERSHEAFMSGYDDHAQAVTIRDPHTSQPRRVVRRDLSDLVPLWRHRREPWHPKVRALMKRDRDLTLTIDVRLQERVSALLREQLAAAGLERGAAVVMDPDNGDLLACVSEPSPAGPLRGDEARFASIDAATRTASAAGAVDPDPDPAASPLMDRARFGLYPPGSTFKIVTAAAALTQDAALERSRYVCRPLPGGRAGAVVEGRLVRDDAGHAAHGSIGMEEALIVSCNAYYAQLGRSIGWPALRDMGRRFGISMGDPEDDPGQRASAIESAYGQARVVATPLTMARVAAAMAAGGRLPSPHVVSKPAPATPESVVVSAGAAADITRMMRGVVERGTARRIAAMQPAIAGKTGTAEITNGTSHAWFIGYAPYGSSAAAASPRPGAHASRGRRIAFSILIENGGYGGARATELAGRIVAEARRLGII